MFLKGKSRHLLKDAREWKIFAKPNWRARSEIGRFPGWTGFASYTALLPTFLLLLKSV